MGTTTLTIIGYECPRCKKSEGIINQNIDGCTYFCMDDKCLKDDCEASKPSNLGTFQPTKNDNVSDRFGLGHKYRNSSLMNWMAEQQHKDVLAKWLKAKKNFLIVLGNPGCGKTHLCASVGDYLSKEQVAYYNIRTFYATLQSSIQSGQGQYESINAIATNNWLILDDIGASSNTEWQKEMLFDLIDQRYSSELPTLITSNLDYKQIRSAYGDRFLRRLANKSNYHIIINLNEHLDLIV